MRIEGASAIVTGGASGLGAATARALAGEGARVVILDRQEEAGRQLPTGFLLPVQDHHPRAFTGKRSSGGSPQSRCTPGDNCRGTFNPHF